MPRSIITALEQKLEISEIVDVVVTTIEQDTDGNYVREIRFFGTPAEGQTASVQNLVVRIKSATKANLDLTTPALQF